MATNLSKNSASAFNWPKPGEGYPYDSYLTYDEEFDPQTGRAVYYDGIGVTSTATNVSKNSSSPTNQSKS